MKNIARVSIVCLMAAISTVSYATTAHKNLKGEATKEAETKSEEEAASPVTGTFDITTNYIFRGVSQSSNLPAVQGGFTYTFLTPGIYFNIWGSNVYMPVTDTSSTATLELDAVAGIANSINDNTSYDLHFVRYNYPKATAFQYNEIIGSLTWRFLTGLIGYSNNVFNAGVRGVYYNLALNFDIPAKYVYFDNVSVNGAAGHYSLSNAAGKSYNDYSLLVNKGIKNYTLTLQWTTTNHRLLNNSLDSAHLLGTVTASF